MRKLLFIVLAFTACLLFPEGGDGACIRQQAPSAAFSAGDMHTDEWQCERTYNSDLNHQPRVLREAESCPAQPSFRYGDRQVPAGRSYLRYDELYFERSQSRDVVALVAEGNVERLLAMPHARVPAVSVAMCRTPDNRFAAMQAFEYADLEYRPLTRLQISPLKEEACEA